MDIEEKLQEIFIDEYAGETTDEVEAFNIWLSDKDPGDWIILAQKATDLIMYDVLIELVSQEHMGDVNSYVYCNVIPNIKDEYVKKLLLEELDNN